MTVKMRPQEKVPQEVGSFPLRFIGQNLSQDFLAGEGKKKKKKKKPKKKKLEQSDPPRVGLSKLFPTGVYPEGELQPYKDEYVVGIHQFVRYILISAVSFLQQRLSNHV